MSDAPRRHRSTAVHNNMHGYRGVEWNQYKGKFLARIEPATGRRGKYLGRFDSAVDAALAYDEAAREIYGEHAYLNFPREGENQTVPSRRSDGLCPDGHLLAEHGYEHPDGRGVTCRKCNAAARMRSYRKKRAAE